jgi:hypothetical protein
MGVKVFCIHTICLDSHLTYVVADPAVLALQSLEGIPPASRRLWIILVLDGSGSHFSLGLEVMWFRVGFQIQVLKVSRAVVR